MKRLLALVVVFICTVFFVGCSKDNFSSAEPNGIDSTPSTTVNDASSQTEDISSTEDLKTYTVVHVNGEPNWDMIPALDIDIQQWLDPVDIEAHAQLCYSDESLYVHMWAREANIRAEYEKSDLLAKTYEDSCLEFFISPVPDDNRYMNFEFNPNGAVGAEIGTTKTDRIKLLPSEDPYQAKTAYTQDGWEITYQIPYSYIRMFYPSFEIEPGMELRANFYKCGNLTVNKHYLSWNPIESDTPNFHMLESFGVLVFR